MDPIFTIDLKDPKKQEKLRKNTFKQADNAEAQQKFDLIEKG